MTQIEWVRKDTGQDSANNVYFHTKKQTFTCDDVKCSKWGFEISGPGNSPKAENFPWYVSYVEPKGPAETFGMRVGYKITHVDGTKLTKENYKSVANDLPFTNTGSHQVKVFKYPKMHQHWDKTRDLERIELKWDDGTEIASVTIPSTTIFRTNSTTDRTRVSMENNIAIYEDDDEVMFAYRGTSNEQVSEDGKLYYEKMGQAHDVLTDMEAIFGGNKSLARVHNSKRMFDLVATYALGLKKRILPISTQHEVGDKVKLLVESGSGTRYVHAEITRKYTKVEAEFEDKTWGVEFGTVNNHALTKKLDSWKISKINKTGQGTDACLQVGDTIQKVDDTIITEYNVGTHAFRDDHGLMRNSNGTRGLEKFRKRRIIVFGRDGNYSYDDTWYDLKIESEELEKLNPEEKKRFDSQTTAVKAEFFAKFSTKVFKNMSQIMNMNTDNGVIDRVDPGSEADTLGVKARWTIISVNGKECKREQAFELVKNETKSGAEEMEIKFILPSDDNGIGKRIVIVGHSLGGYLSLETTRYIQNDPVLKHYAHRIRTTAVNPGVAHFGEAGTVEEYAQMDYTTMLCYRGDVASMIFMSYEVKDLVLVTNSTYEEYPNNFAALIHGFGRWHGSTRFISRKLCIKLHEETIPAGKTIKDIKGVTRPTWCFGKAYDNSTYDATTKDKTITFPKRAECLMKGQCEDTHESLP